MHSNATNPPTFWKPRSWREHVTNCFIIFFAIPFSLKLESYLVFEIEWEFSNSPVETETVNEYCRHNDENNSEVKPPFRVWLSPKYVGGCDVRSVVEKRRNNGKYRCKNAPFSEYRQWRRFVQKNFATIYDLKQTQCIIGNKTLLVFCRIPCWCCFLCYSLLCWHGLQLEQKNCVPLSRREDVLLLGYMSWCPSFQGHEHWANWDWLLARQA